MVTNHDEVRAQDLPAAGARQHRGLFQGLSRAAVALDRLHRHHRSAVGRGNAYNPLSGFPPDMPYFCLRVPTGGGKTWLAAKSVALVNTHLLRCEHSVILWLVPSKPIREQTLRALRDRAHPYHKALREARPGRGASASGCATLSDARAVRSSCRRPMGAFIWTFCASCWAAQSRAVGAGAGRRVQGRGSLDQRGG